MSWTVQPQFTPKNRLPALCSKCGCALRNRPNRPSGRESAIIPQPGIVIDFEGDVEFCETCITEAAKVLGFATAETVAELEADKAVLEAQVTELRDVVDEQSLTIRGLTNELSRLESADA